MATLQVSSLFLVSLYFAFMLISPTHSLKCTSQNFTNNNLYKNCIDLPTLTAYLYWTYDSSKSSLSVAFTAAPATSDGWISWAINPTGDGMVGAQSLIAFKSSNGSMFLKTYNITSYESIKESKIAFQVSGASADSSGGVMRIFATLALPENTTAVNQVWQVGGSVTNGVPDKHEFRPANINAKGVLDLVKSGGAGNSNGSATANVPAPAPAPAPVPVPVRVPSPSATTSNSQSGGVSRIGSSNFRFCCLFLFLVSFVMSF